MSTNGFKNHENQEITPIEITTIGGLKKKALEGNAWKYDETTKAYYLHYFSVKQPDLKWENPKVRQEVYNLMQFWFEKGVDGFRMDVISFISKDSNFPKLPESYNGEYIPFYSNGPKLHDYLQEMNQSVLSKYDVMTVGEAPGIGLENALDFVDEDRKELNMFFHFDLMALDREQGETFQMAKEAWKLTDFKKIHSDWDAAFSKKGWGSMYLNNHDFPRSVSRWGNDSRTHWFNSATMLHTFLLSMRGTPFFHYGEEIGMTNIRFDNISDYQDINTINRYKTIQENGGDLEAFIENEKDASRDNARTPMQWDASVNAGFSKAKPWIKVNSNYEEGINVASQEGKKSSVLNYFRQMTQVRKDNSALIYGSYQLLLAEDEEVYAYLRKMKEERYLVLLSFSTQKVLKTITEVKFEKAKLVISNDEIYSTNQVNSFELMPYQACIYELF